MMSQWIFNNCPVLWLIWPSITVLSIFTNVNLRLNQRGTYPNWFMTYLSEEMAQVYLWASRDLMLVTLNLLVSKLLVFLLFWVNKDPTFSLSTVSLKSLKKLPSDQKWLNGFETSLWMKNEQLWVFLIFLLFCLGFGSSCGVYQFLLFHFLLLLRAVWLLFVQIIWSFPAT